MRQRSLLKTLLFMIPVAGLVACSKNEPAANPVPVIKYRSITKYTLAAARNLSKRDSVVITTDYSDGDGDLGEDRRDTTRQKQVFASQSWGNYEIRTFQLVNGQFSEIVPLKTDKLFFEPLTGNTRSTGSISGLIDYSQLFSYTGNYTLALVKFQVRMRDRNLNVSNVIETDTLRVPIGL